MDLVTYLPFERNNFLQSFYFINTSALPMGFLPDSYPQNLMISYSMIKSSPYPLYISMLELA